jgi:hypothetical protein
MPTFNTDTPKPGYVYDSTDDTWYPLAGIAIQSLDGLTDVVISSAASGQTLVYNGTNWVNTAETGDISALTSGTGITLTNATGPVPTVALTTSSITINGSSVSLGGSVTITGESFHPFLLMGA